MPPAAILGAGIGAQGIGSILGARAANPKLTPVPPPAPVFPELNQQYIGSLGKTGPGAINQLSQISQTGMPVDVMPYFNSIVAAQQRLKSQGQANVVEGLPAYGSIRRDALVDYNTQSTKDFTSILSGLMQQMYESAANRSLSASGLLSQMFGGSAMTLAPTAALTTGGRSPLGAGLSSVGSGIEQIALLQAFGIL